LHSDRGIDPIEEGEDSYAHELEGRRAAAGLLITGTVLGTLAVHAQSTSPKPDPSRSSYISVNEEDFATVLARMSAARAGIMKRQMDLLACATT